MKVKNNSLHKLTLKDREKIIERLRNGVEGYRIANEFKVSAGTISRIKLSHPELADDVIINKVSKKSRRLTIDQKTKIIERLNSGEQTIDLSAEFGVSTTTISYIRKNYSSIVARVNALSQQKGLNNITPINLGENRVHMLPKRRILTEDEKEGIINLLNAGEAGFRVADTIGVSRCTVYKMKKHLTKLITKNNENIVPENKKLNNRLLSNEQQEEIMRRLNAGEKGSKIADATGVSRASVSRIKKNLPDLMKKMQASSHKSSQSIIPSIIPKKDMEKLMPKKRLLTTYEREKQIKHLTLRIKKSLRPIMAIKSKVSQIKVTQASSGCNVENNILKKQRVSREEESGIIKRLLSGIPNCRVAVEFQRAPCTISRIKKKYAIVNDKIQLTKLKKKRRLNIEEKNEIIRLLIAGEKGINIASKFGVSPSAISYVKKKKISSSS